MSHQRFSLQFREALWETHDRRCIYSKTSLLFSEMEVDHVIPEQLLSDPPTLANLKLEMGLLPSFDVLGYENLAPSCRKCNGEKHGRPFPPGYGMIALGQVAEKLPLLRAAIDRKRQDRDLDNTLRHIARSLDKGLFSPDDLLKGIEIIRKHPNGIHGSSPNAPPASPETREAEIRFSRVGQLRWAPDASASMLKNGYSADQVNDMIYRALKNGSIMAERVLVKERPTYMIRVRPDVRVVFSVVDDFLLVTSFHRKLST